jgi:formylglycine-generating enzyme required for sulfatase activity
MQDKFYANQVQTLINSIGMKLVRIPAGTFKMGSPQNEQYRSEFEDQYDVTLTQDYFLGAFAVTQAQYTQVMGENPSYFQGDGMEGDSSHHPVEQVAWDDAVEFCQRLSKLPAEKASCRVYRLPTEAEWEYACRAGSQTAYCFGGNLDSLDDYAWFDDNSDEHPHPVGEKQPNAWGLYDMHGNVWEWCSDWYGEYPKGAVCDPVGPSEGLRPRRVYRGGGWGNGAGECRSSNRVARYVVYRNRGVGFRLALSPAEIRR